MAEVLDLADTADWIAAAGYATRIESDATVISNRGGEIRHYIRALDDWIEVRRAERGGHRFFQFSSSDSLLVQKHLVLRLAPVVRERSGLPPLRVPMGLDDLPVGFVIANPSVDIDVLLGHGVEIARFCAGDWIYPAVEFAHVADAPLDVIMASFTDSAGAPLFGGE